MGKSSFSLGLHNFFRNSCYMNEKTLTHEKHSKDYFEWKTTATIVYENEIGILNFKKNQITNNKCWKHIENNFH